MAKTYGHQVNAWRYLIKLNENDATFLDTALNTALEYQRDELVRACIYMQSQTQMSKNLKALSDDWRFTLSWVHVFMQCMRECNEDQEIAAFIAVFVYTVYKLTYVLCTVAQT